MRQMVSDDVEEFWNYFLSRRQDFEDLTSSDDPLYDALLAKLQRVHPDLYIEFCTTPGENELILTAEGKMELFELVEEVVAQAPEISGWRIFALKPKLGFPQTTRWEGHEVRIADVMVVPVRHRETGRVGLHLYVEGATPKNEYDIHSALLRAIDHGLGERCFAERVQATWVHPIKELPKGVSSFPLMQLDEYVCPASDPC